jgi:transglutaminase-like putative cysteine protease
VLEHFESDEPDCPIEAYARSYPFRYASDEIPDLARSIELQYPDPLHAVDEWAKAFIMADGPTDTWGLLGAITKAVQRDFTYLAREAEGIQTPAETLATGTGSCFVSGYLYVPDADGSGNVGGGATHAWTQVYLPGAGWVEFDPTNGIIGNRDLIRVAVARDPNHAVPLQGTWTGLPSDYLGMHVQVEVTAEPE